MALLMLLFALAIAAPAMWNTSQGLQAFSGLLSEAKKNYTSALNTYTLLHETDLRTDGWDLLGNDLGLDSGNFPMERQYIIEGKTVGPLYFMYSGSLPRITDVYSKAPKSLRRLSAQCNIIGSILEGLGTVLQAPAAEGQPTAEWQLAGLEKVHGADEQAKERKLYYDSIAVHIAASDPGMKPVNLLRIAELRKEPAAEFWMYEDTAFDYAVEDGDYAAVIAFCDTRLKRNREDLLAMQYKVKALFLNGDAEKAFAAVEDCAKHPLAADVMQVAKAELFVRQERYEEAVFLCETVLNQAAPTEPLQSQVELQSLQCAMEAARIKALALLMMGNAEEARNMLFNA